MSDLPKIIWLTAPNSKTVLSGFASKNCHFAIIAEGALTPKEMRNIIRLLEVQITLAEEDDATLSPSTNEQEDGR